VPGDSFRPRVAQHVASRIPGKDVRLTHVQHRDSGGL
jgi:hypothetical protein